MSAFARTWIAGLLLVAPVAAAEQAPVDGLAGGVQRSREMMATRVTIAIVDARPAAELDAAFEEAFGAFARVEDVMNEWRRESVLSQINAAAGRDAVAAPADLCEVLRLSLDGARRTNGLFDPTWAALRGLWKFGTGAARVVPKDADVKARCALVGGKDVVIEPIPGGEPGACRVRLSRAGMQLGLGGIAKGWGVDRAVASLRARGLRNFFVQAGGDLYAAGRKGDRPWRVGIRDPRGPEGKVFAVADIEDAAFSTSGDYERFFILDGRRYHHIIDLRTCRPAGASRSATVLAKSAVEAEILTKSAFVLGGPEGLKLAESSGAGAVLVGADNRVHVSKSLEGRVRHWAPTP